MARPAGYDGERAFQSLLYWIRPSDAKLAEIEKAQLNVSILVVLD